MLARRRLVLLLVIVLGCFALALLGFAGARALGPVAAHAQASDSGSVASTPSSNSTPASASTPSATNVTGSDKDVAILLVVLGAFALGLVYLFLWGWMRGVVRLSKVSVEAGLGLPDYVLNQAEISPVTTKGLEETPALIIIGPPVVTVGQPAKFKARLGEAPATDVTWSVVGDGATVAPAQGAETSLTATSAGTFTLTATAGQAKGQATIAALPAAERQRGGLPVIGVGYAGLTVAIIALTAAAALTALGVFPAAALATLLGTIVSYFFVRREGASGASNGSSGSGAVPPNPPGS